MTNESDFPGDKPFPTETAKKKNQTVTVAANTVQQMPASQSQLSEHVEFLAMIERAARDPAVDVAKLKGLLEIRNEQEIARAKREFNIAMNAAQSEMRRIATDSTNKQTGSKYASYAALDRVIRPIYVSKGFGLSFDTGDCPSENSVRVLCYVTHTDGYERTYRIDMPADGKGAKGGDVMTKTHATSSAVAYGKRYLLGMIFNIAIGEDDDGNAAANTQEFLSQKQVDDLTKLIVDTGGDVKKFCAFAHVEALSNIYANRYDAAVDAVKRAAAQRKTAAAKKGGK